jgi:hypothetical protein
MNALAWIRGYSMGVMVTDRGKGQVKAANIRGSPVSFSFFSLSPSSQVRSADFGCVSDFAATERGRTPNHRARDHRRATRSPSPRPRRSSRTGGGSVVSGAGHDAQKAPKEADARNETLQPEMSLKFWISPTNANDGVVAV